MSSCEVYVITDSKSDATDLDNYSPDYITKAVRAYERKQEASRAYYARMSQDPKWKEARNAAQRERRRRQRAATNKQ